MGGTGTGNSRNILMSTSDKARELIDEVTACISADRQQLLPLVVDVEAMCILCIGDNIDNHQVNSTLVAASPNRYHKIPTRGHLEKMEHVNGFIAVYFPDERYLHDQAIAAADKAMSVDDWRNLLGDQHRAVIAFNEYMHDFYRIVAHMIVHGTPRPRIGLLGHRRV